MDTNLILIEIEEKERYHVERMTNFIKDNEGWKSKEVELISTDDAFKSYVVSGNPYTERFDEFLKRQGYKIIKYKK